MENKTDAQTGFSMSTFQSVSMNKDILI